MIKYNNKNFEDKKKNVELILYQKQSVNVIKFITDKFLYVFTDSHLQKWGFNKRSPQTTVDVSGNVNTNSDYLINYHPIMPIGTIIQYAGINAPTGWLLCNGASYNVATDYNRLYDVIGTTYGGGNNEEENYFNVPNFTGRVPIGTANGFAIGSVGGSITHTLTVPEMPSHNHTHNANGGSQGISYKGDGGTPGSIDSGGNEINCTNTRALEINNTGGGNAFSIMQPYIVVNYIIRY